MRHAEIIDALLIAAAGAFLTAGVLWLARRARAGRALAAVGWGLATALLALNSWLAQAPPFGNMYQVQVLLALCFLPASLLLRTRGPFGWTAPYFAFASAVPLIGALFLDKDIGWRRMPALQSAWFVPHVTAYMIAYSFAAVAFALTLVRLVRRRPDSDSHAAAAREVVRLSFPFMTFGLLSGALWADLAWASYWSWDPKETWSLITWLLYASYLHIPPRSHLRRLADGVQFLAFAALLVTFIVVNLAPRFVSPLHGYAR